MLPSIINSDCYNRSRGFSKKLEFSVKKLEATMIYTMMQVCKEADLTYQALKFYCNEGLIPNVKRDKTTGASLMKRI